MFQDLPPVKGHNVQMVLRRAAGHDENGLGRHDSCRTAASYRRPNDLCGDTFRQRG